MSNPPPKLPPELEKIVDKVLAYHPEPKSKAARKRKQLAKTKGKSSKTKGKSSAE
jgi:hypothetical protein